MFNFLRPFIAPIVAPFLGALLAYLQVHYHIIYTPDQVGQIRDGAVSAVLWLLAVGASLAGVIKVTLNKWLNKANAATTELAAAGQIEGHQLKGIVTLAGLSAGHNPIPPDVRAKIWDLLRPYADNEVIKLPLIGTVTIRWFLHRIIGSDRQGPSSPIAA